MGEVRLRVLKGPDAGQVFDLEGTMVIGRDPGSDLVLGDEQVSWRHLELAVENGRVSIADLHSTNGTFVNDVLIVDTRPLSLGDRIQVGQTLLEVADAQPARPVTRVAPVRGVRQNSIVADGLVREFRGGLRAVDSLDLEVFPGEIYGFLGPNGAGKSTTVHMLTTLLPPTAGTARGAGYDIVEDGPKVRASIGAALQEAALDPWLTGREHLRLQSALHGLPRRDRERRANELLERV